MVEDIFDTVAASNFKRRAALKNTAGSDFLLAHVVEDMADRLNFVERSFKNAAITSGNAQFIPKGFLAQTRHANTIFCDTSSLVSDYQNQNEERLPAVFHNLDLALSFLSLHETNDTPGALVQIRQSLRPDGLFLGVMSGGETLYELRQCLLEAETEISGGAGPRVYPFADVRAAGALLQRAGFALPVVDGETITVRYRDMFALMRDLRNMGASNALRARSRKATRRSVFLRAAEIYQDQFGESDGKIPATFSFIWMSGWAPDASQAKPAKRGSGNVSLAEALKTIDS